jgi:MATE family multidrug resistance protein
MIRKGTEITNVVFIGYLNDTALLAGVGMGNMIANLAAMSAFYGFSSAMDTLQSQAAGAGNLELCGVYLHRARVIICIIYVPILFLLLNCKPFLLAVGQDK